MSRERNCTRRDVIRWVTGTGVVTMGDAARAIGGIGSKQRGNLAAAQVSAAAVYSAKHRGHALLVKQHGRVIHESYSNGAKASTARRIYSGTKGFWGLAALAAMEDGLMDWEEDVADTIVEWRDEKGKQSITIQQLLQFTCGLERALKIHNDGLADRNQIALDRPLVAKPGRAFIYGPSAMQVLHEVMKRKLRGRWRKESPTSYLERKVLRPMGLGAQRYLPDKKGNPLLAAGFVMTAQQWSRMGDVLVRSGKPVVDKGSFERLTEGSAVNHAYSCGFWNNGAADSGAAWEVPVEEMLNRDWSAQSWSRACLCLNAPPDLIACVGSGNQRLYAIPSLELVVVRQGQGGSFSDAQFLRILLD